MKKITILIVLLFAGLFSYADYNGDVTTSQRDLIFTSINGYDVVSFKKGFYTEEIGAPQLPVKILSFVIPVDQKVSNIIINSTNVEQLAGTFNIYPVQTPVPTNLAPDAFPFDDPDTAIYNSNNPYPGKLFEIIDDGYPMGYHVVTIKFYPVEYIPASKILNLYTNINFTIVYENNTETILLPNRQSTYSNNLSKGYVKSIITNPDDIDFVTGGAKQVISYGSTSNIKGMNPTNLTFIPDYIIITSSDLINSFKPLSDWKTQKGVYTLIVDIQDIYSNYQGIDNAEKIRNYLKDVYVNFGSSYILLGGDVDIVPARFTPIFYGNYETNFYFATVQRDWNEDGDNIFGEGSDDNTDYSKVFDVGRAPVNNQSQADNFVNKVIRYEKLDNTTNKNYVNNLSFWAGDNKEHADPFTNLNKIDNSTSGYINPENYYVLKLYDKYQNHIGESSYSNRYFELSRNNVLNSLNTGWNSFGQNYGNIHLIYHCDHSGPDAMGTSTYDKKDHIYKSDMDALTNGINYSQILYTDGCKPNQFSLDAISEHYINNQNGGGVAFIGNSDAGHWGDDYYFKTYFCQSLYDLTKPDAYDNKYYRLGFLNNYSATVNSQRLKNRNLLGDPEMMVWTDIPQNLTVTNLNYSPANKEITGTVSGLTFTTTSQVIVTVCSWKGDEIYSTQDISATTSSISFTISNVMADTPGDIIVTVTAHNYIPNINTINVPSITGAHPYMTSYTIDDSAPNGNNDQQPDAGETILLPVTLTNSGNITANNVTATLSWQPSPYQASDMISIINNSSTLGDISAGGNANNSGSPYEFTINKDAFENITPRPLTMFANFKISIYINGTLFSEKTFDIQITEPNIEKGENIVTGTLAASSSNELTIKLYNKGLSQATGLTATLTTNNPSNITITNGTNISYNNLDGVNTSTNSGINTIPFGFDIGSADYSNETFNLAVTNQYGKTWTFNNFNLSIPLIDISNSSINHEGYETAIKLFWNIILSTTTDIKGYNLYRSFSLMDPYLKINSNIIPYSFYLDEGLQPLTEYYYKITVVDENGNESDLYPSNGYMASTSLPFHNGWPIAVTSNINLGSRAEGSPNVMDVDEDENKEIFFFTGTKEDKVGGVWAFKSDGSRWFMIEPNATHISGFINLQCNTTSTPALGDINGDGNIELGITTRNISTSPNSQNLFVYETTIDNNEDNLPDEKFYTHINGYEVDKGAVFSDINNNGNLEIITKNRSDGQWPQGVYSHGGIKIFNSDGSVHTGWENTTGYNCGFSMPVAFDFDNDNDNKKEIVIGCTNSTTHTAGIYLWKEDGTPYSTNPIYTPEPGFRVDFPPVVCDLDNKGSYDIIFISAKNNDAYIYAIKPDGSSLNGWDNNTHKINLSNTVKTSSIDDICYGVNSPNLAVGDINGNGKKEIIIGGNNKIYIWENDGNLLNTINIPDYSSEQKVPLIADIDNIHNDMEIIVTDDNENAKIYAYKCNGEIIEGFPISIDKKIRNTPCISDVDNDGKNELFVSTSTNFYLWDTPGLAHLNEWGSYRHDSYNSGIYQKNCEYTNIPLEITTNTQWDSYKRLNCDVIVKQGKVLTINKHGEIYMPTQSKIIVENGAKLIINGGKISSGCFGSMWRGIQVWGNSSASQWPDTSGICQQGYLELHNATIENAVCAVELWRPDHWGTQGGIIYADSSIFRNNAKSVHALHYSNYNPYFPEHEMNYRSGFNHCTFEITEDYAGDNTFYKNVDLSQVKGINFRACNFTLDKNAAGVSEWNSGIAAYNAGFSVYPVCNSNTIPCSDYDKCTFNGFYSAINAIGDINNTNTFSVSRAVFNNNIYGVKVSGIHNESILFSEFNIGYNNTGEKDVCTNASGAGIYLDNSTGFAIEENYFTKYTGAPSGNYIGIFISNTKNADEVYRNTFEGLSYANYAKGKNWKDNSIYEGLAYFCNQNTNNYADFYVAQDLNNPSGIQSNQGDDEHVTGNKFSQTDATWHFYNGGNYQIDYYYCDYCENENPDNDKIFNVTDKGKNFNNTCPSHYGGNSSVSIKELVLTPPQKQEAEQEYYNNLTDYNNVKTLYNNLVDGGNTDSELADIQTAQPDDMWALRAQLLGDSPHLSMEVLKEAADKTDVFPESVIFDIMAANPDELKKEELIKYLEDKENPLPDYMIDILKQVSTGTTYKTVLQQQMSRYNRNKTRAAYDIIRSILNDTVTDFAELRNWLDNVGGIRADEQIIASYIQQDNYTDALSLANMLPALYDMEGDEITEHNYYMDILNLHFNLQQQGRNILELDSTEVSSLVSIAENSRGTAGAQAKNILEYGYGYHYCICPNLNGTASYKNSNININTFGNAYGIKISVRPNPAREWTTFNYQLRDDISKGVIKITDVYGKLIESIDISGYQGQRIWDTRNVKPGIYFYTLNTVGFSKSGKIIISGNYRNK